MSILAPEKKGLKTKNVNTEVCLEKPSPKKKIFSNQEKELTDVKINIIMDTFSVHDFFV